MYPVPKLVWLRKNAPEIFKAARWFLGVTDYLLLRLGLQPLIDYSHAARFMALDVRALTWSREVLEMAQVSQNALATPVQAGTIAGRLGAAAAASLGIPEGTPVVVGGHDQVIGAVGLGVVGAGRAAGSLGTYECILVVSDQPQLNRAALDRGLNSYPHAVPGKFVTIAYFPSGIMLQWLSGLLRGAHDAEDSESLWKLLESEAPDGPTGLLVTPHLIGTCNPEFDSRATAAIHGLTPSSTRAHLYKGVLEGIASELTLIVECLESAGSAFSHINVSGGGVHSAMGMRLRAAFTGKHLHIMSGQESVCLGGAMLASVALGAHADVEAAAKAMVREETRIDPDSDLARQYGARQAGYRRFRSLLVQSNANSFSQQGEQS
jgi:xylulokinase